MRVEKDGKTGFLSKEGELVVPLTLIDLNKNYHELSDHFDSRGSHIGDLGPVKRFWVSPFSNGYAVLKSKKTRLIGVIDQQFNVVVPVAYRKIMVDDTGGIHVWK